jgi:PhzF family phenazine biosynthesis protein
MIRRRFIQCDVFTSAPTKGNGLAVVIDGEGLSDPAMQDFAAWTNLAETTFLMSPRVAGADYRVRIFTPAREMLFAGHPTLGSCAAWLRSGGTPKIPGVVKQECGIGIVDIDLSRPIPAFAAPETTVAPLPDDKLKAIVSALGLAPDRILRTAQLSNGPKWQVIELASAADVLAADSSKIRYPQFLGIGLIGAHAAGSECDYEVRMLGASSGMSEDPVTGSLNAAIARWKYGSGQWQRPVTVAQGTCVGRSGRVSIRYDQTADTVWIGGQTCFLIDGTLIL